MDAAVFDRRPIVVAIAGPNGAGKTTFYDAHLAATGLPFINADRLASEFGVGAYEAARLAQALRQALLDRKESFLFETVFSDPVGEKVAWLESAHRQGYTVLVCYVGLSGPDESMQRVAMRVSQGGHDVPDEKLQARYGRTLQNLALAVARLPHVLIFDNSDLARPFRLVAEFHAGHSPTLHAPIPAWLAPWIG